MTATVWAGRRLLFLGLNEQGAPPLARPIGPWAEDGRGAPAGCEAITHSLLEILSPGLATELARPFDFVVFDIDAVARTAQLDRWAEDAWRASFNDLVGRAYAAGRTPTLVGFARNPDWTTAQLGARLGARELWSREEFRGDTTLEPNRDLPRIAPFVPRVPSLTPLASVSTSPSASISTPPSASVPRHLIPFPVQGLDGQSAAIEAVRGLIRKSAPLSTSVLIEGATGTGKERVALALHRHSARADRPFLAVACGALSPELIEADLFGHARGAFTGATDAKVGRLEHAHGGTVFLDEVADLSLAAQSKILRVVQEGTLTPVGAQEATSVDLRWVATTQHDLRERVRLGLFREDLYYRLGVIELRLPSLMERRADIPELCEIMLARLGKKHRRAVPAVAEGVIEKFLLHDWPGNVRELENILEHAATLCWGEARKQIEERDLPDRLRLTRMRATGAPELREVVRRFEREYIAATVRRLGGSKEDAAERLGLSLATLYRKLAG